MCECPRRCRTLMRFLGWQVQPWWIDATEEEVLSHRFASEHVDVVVPFYTSSIHHFRCLMLALSLRLLFGKPTVPGPERFNPKGVR